MPSKLSRTLRTIMTHAHEGYSLDPDLWFDAFPQHRHWAGIMYNRDLLGAQQENLDTWTVEVWIFAIISLKIEKPSNTPRLMEIVSRCKKHDQEGVTWEEWIEEEQEWIEEGGSQYPDVPS